MSDTEPDPVSLSDYDFLLGELHAVVSTVKSRSGDPICRYLNNGIQAWYTHAKAVISDGVWASRSLCQKRAISQRLRLLATELKQDPTHRPDELKNILELLDLRRLADEGGITLSSHAVRLLNENRTWAKSYGFPGLEHDPRWTRLQSLAKGPAAEIGRRVAPYYGTTKRAWEAQAQRMWA
ncbi:hypothetical protein JCM10213_006736 [Rhodosporidiobolus nylandii]